jgi:hypothetical protein
VTNGIPLGRPLPLTGTTVNSAQTLKVNADAGLMSNGPYSNMPIVWAWEYGDRSNMTEIKERWFPLVKGEVDKRFCLRQQFVD